MIQDFINKQFFSLFVFTLIFGLLLYGTIGFDFIDEICATLLFILFGYSLFKSQEWLINKAFLTTIGVFLFYLCYSLCINSNTKAAIITDFIIQFKPYLALFCVYSLRPHFSTNQKKILRIICVFFLVDSTNTGLYRNIQTSYSIKCNGSRDLFCGRSHSDISLLSLYRRFFNER